MNKNPEIIYLMGALRDATVDNRNLKNYEIKIYQKDERWLSKVIKPILEDNFGVRVSLKDNLLRMYSKKAVLKLIEISGIKTHGWNTPPFIRKLPAEHLKPYIMGFWDAEGGLPKDCLNTKQRYISFHQKEQEPLIFVKKILESLGFITTNITFCKKAHEFRITRKEHIKKFILEIGSRHPDKSRRLQDLLKTLI